MLKHIDKTLNKLNKVPFDEARSFFFSAIRGKLLCIRYKFDPAILFVFGKVKVHQRMGTIEIADYVRFYDGVKLSCVGNHLSQATIKISKSASIGDRTEIHAGKSVVIGERVMISWDCLILDRDYHGFDEQPEEIKPVVIEDEAWIGCRSIILKGVTIGKKAIIGAGSVVTKDIPAYAVACGNPAKVVRIRQ